MADTQQTLTVLSSELTENQEPVYAPLQFFSVIVTLDTASRALDAVRESLPNSLFFSWVGEDWRQQIAVLDEYTQKAPVIWQMDETEYQNIWSKVYNHPLRDRAEANRHIIVLLLSVRNESDLDQGQLKKLSREVFNIDVEVS